MTDRAQLALTKILENRGKISVGEAMRQAHYSDVYADNPQQFLKTIGIRAALKHNKLTPEFIFKRLNQLINKQEVVIISDGARDGSHWEYTGQPHSDVAKGIDIAAKIGRLYPSEKSEGNQYNQQNNILVLPSELIDKYDTDEAPKYHREGQTSLPDAPVREEVRQDNAGGL